MPRQFRVAVIGRTGRGNYGHGLDIVWRIVDNVQVVAVADDNEQGRAAAATRLGVRNAYADYRQMLQKERPNIVSVATRSGKSALKSIAISPPIESPTRCALRAPKWSSTRLRSRAKSWKSSGPS